MLRLALPFVLILIAPAGTAAEPPPRFDPLAFFAGYTEGVGDMASMLRQPVPIAVHGRGTVAADGTLVLDQVVEQWGRPTRRRTWRIHAVAPGRYAGTLTDAIGPVAGEAVGDRLHLTYRMVGQVGIDQWLTLAPDGRSARNVMRVRKRGVPVARLDETIRRSGD